MLYNLIFLLDNGINIVPIFLMQNNLFKYYYKVNALSFYTGEQLLIIIDISIYIS